MVGQLIGWKNILSNGVVFRLFQSIASISVDPPEMCGQFPNPFFLRGGKCLQQRHQPEPKALSWTDIHNVFPTTTGLFYYNDDNCARTSIGFDSAATETTAPTEDLLFLFAPRIFFHGCRIRRSRQQHNIHSKCESIQANN